MLSQLEKLEYLKSRKKTTVKDTLQILTKTISRNIITVQKFAVSNSIKVILAYISVNIAYFLSVSLSSSAAAAAWEATVKYLPGLKNAALL